MWPNCNFKLIRLISTNDITSSSENKWFCKHPHIASLCLHSQPFIRSFYLFFFHWSLSQILIRLFFLQLPISVYLFFYLFTTTIITHPPFIVHFFRNIPSASFLFFSTFVSSLVMPKSQLESWIVDTRQTDSTFICPFSLWHWLKASYTTCIFVSDFVLFCKNISAKFSIYSTYDVWRTSVWSEPFNFNNSKHSFGQNFLMHFTRRERIEEK